MDDLVEALSAAAHVGWMEGKRAQGKESRVSEWGEELMVPYDQLTEQAKGLDRSAVESVVAAVERAGYKLVKAGE